MSPKTKSVMIQYMDQTLECLVSWAQNRMMRSSTSNVPDERERIFRELSSLQISYKVLGQHVQRRIADVSQQLNSLAPINRLPDELFSKIFALTLAAEFSKEYKMGLVTLRLVSRDWSKIILETPLLWAQIGSSYSNRANMAAILRSKEASLRVKYIEDCYPCRKRAVPNSKFIKLAVRESRRWESAEFVVCSKSTLALPRDFVTLSAPRLEELKISYAYPQMEILDMEEGIDIFCGGVDRLRHIDLSDFPIR
ncbi:hypothetical protein FRB93_004476 [Tulasnella sp. JGI-2019a]|nr:hypothetical protein FRB93_004476 [Tulasnella sp. JGI-2019a]